MKPKALCLVVRRALAAHSNPDFARDMQRYMKSTMPYHGVKLA